LFLVAGSTLSTNDGGSGSADGTGAAARFAQPVGIAADAADNLYVADSSNLTIRKISAAGVVTTLAGTAGMPGSADGSGAAAQFLYPFGIAADAAGNVYVADLHARTIRKITAAGVVTTLAGTAGVSGSADGSGAAARFASPVGIAADAAGNLYVADFDNYTIRKITAAGVVTTLAGTAGVSGSADGSGAAARFSGPNAIALDTAGNLYVTDLYNCTVRKITSAGMVTTLAGAVGVCGNVDGKKRDARLGTPAGIAMDAAGNLYVAEPSLSTIRKIAASSGEVTTVAGVAFQRSIQLGDLPGSLDFPLGATTLPGTNGRLALTTGNSVLQLVVR
jgi:sugar lactone lactonase YvrE